MLQCRGYLLLFILSLSSHNIWAHQDFWKVEDFGNVKVRIQTGYQYEEIHKAFIFGRLAQRLAAELNYRDQIFLDFSHHYTGPCEAAHFISFDRGGIEYTLQGTEGANPFLAQKSIVIRQVAYQFDAKTTLQLVEFAIRNLDEVMSTQKQIEFNKNYCHWKINSIATHRIEELLQKPQSSILVRILASKVERPEKHFKNGLSYFYANGTYTLYARKRNRVDTNLLQLDNVYSFQRLGNTVIVFDSDSSFYCLHKDGYRVSKRHAIEIPNGYEKSFEPFHVERISTARLSIHYACFPKQRGLQVKEKKLVYAIDADELMHHQE